MRIKQEPEDFVVEELADHETGKGEWTLVRMTKRNMTTERAISRLVEFVKLPRRRVTYAGTKDKRAVTTQYVTLRNPARLERFSSDRITLEVIGHVREPLGLGNLDGNRFKIVVRDIDSAAEELTWIPNYFDKQRFSVANADIGLRLIRQEYEEAAGLVAGTDIEHGERLDAYLEEHPNDCVGALKLIPRHTLLMYVHAYQSRLFNEVLTKFIEYNDMEFVEISPELRLPLEKLPSVPIHLVGFDSTMPEPFQAWYDDLLEHDGLTYRDFVNRQFPFLTMEGTTRQAFVEIGELQLSPVEEGTQRIEFTLPKGAYATVVIQCLYRQAITPNP